MKATIRLSVETQDGEITITKSGDNDPHIGIWDIPPVNREVLFECIDKIEDKLKGKK